MTKTKPEIIDTAGEPEPEIVETSTHEFDEYSDPVEDAKIVYPPKPKAQHRRKAAESLFDELDEARQEIFKAARRREVGTPVPDVIARTLKGKGDVLLVVWRAWNIYATLDGKNWVIRVD